MKRCVVLMLFVPALAAAQTPVPVQPDPPAQARSAAARADAGGRRKPSMVGYIGDSSTDSKFRIRFDAGYGVGAADRAEFFYAKCGCYRGLPTNHVAYDPNAAGPGPGVLTSTDFQQLYLLGEYAAAPRVSVFAELPFRFLKPQQFVPGTGSFGNWSGVSDLRGGVKFGLTSSDERQVTASLQVQAPTGDSYKGLGTNHWSIEPVLLYRESPTDRVSIEMQLGEIIPTDGSAGVPVSSPKKFSGKVVYYGFGPSFEVYRSSTASFAPVIELVGWHVIDGFQTVEGDPNGMNIVNLKIGGRLVVRDRSSVYVGYGKALTDNTWYDDIFRIEYRVGFGR